MVTVSLVTEPGEPARSRARRRRSRSRERPWPKRRYTRRPCCFLRRARCWGRRRRARRRHSDLRGPVVERRLPLGGDVRSGVSQRRREREPALTQLVDPQGGEIERAAPGDIRNAAGELNGGLDGLQRIGFVECIKLDHVAIYAAAIRHIMGAGLRAGAGIECERGRALVPIPPYRGLRAMVMVAPGSDAGENRARDPRDRGSGDDHGPVSRGGNGDETGPPRWRATHTVGRVVHQSVELISCASACADLAQDVAPSVVPTLPVPVTASRRPLRRA